MKTKQLINLGVILAVISALVVVKQFQKPKELTTQEYLPLNISFDSSAIESIDFLKPQGGEEQYVEIVKSGSEAWKLKSLSNTRADKNKIEEFLKELKSVKGELRGKDKKVFKDFQIGDDEALQVVLKGKDQKALFDLRVGLKKTARSVFVRRSGSDEVFMTPADLFGKMGIYGDPKTEQIDNSFWAETSLIAVSTDKIEGIEIKHGKPGNNKFFSGVARQLSSEDPSKKVWKFIREGMPFPADETKIKTFLDSFQTWKAARVSPFEKDRNYGFDKSEWEMTLRVEGGEPITIKSGETNTETKMTFLQVSNEPIIFEMSPYYFENMDADDTRFFGDNPLGIDLSKTLQLILRADKKTWQVFPKEKSWPDLEKYFEDLKGMMFTRVLTQPDEIKKVKSPSRYSLEIIKETASTPLVLDFGEIVKETPREQGVIIRGSKYAFAMPEYFYKNTFENVSRLEAPKEEKQEAKTQEAKK